MFSLLLSFVEVEHVQPGFCSCFCSCFAFALRCHSFAERNPSLLIIPYFSPVLIIN